MESWDIVRDLQSVNAKRRVNSVDITPSNCAWRSDHGGHKGSDIEAYVDEVRRRTIGGADFPVKPSFNTPFSGTGEEITS